VTSNETIVELIKGHVLQDAEQVVRVKNWPDGLALTTDRRHFVAGSESPEWSVSNEEWVDDVVIATRDDLIVEGQPERFGFLVLSDGGYIYVNDRDAVADLGRRLADGMDPEAYAQILVAFHPYSSALRGVLTEADGLRQALGQPDLPDVAPLTLQRSSDGVTLTFSSFVRYVRPGESPMVDVLEWQVEVPTGQPARWSARNTETGLRLEQAERSGQRRLNWNTP
jgi:hypothetical protein